MRKPYKSKIPHGKHIHMSNKHGIEGYSKCVRVCVCERQRKAALILFLCCASRKMDFAIFTHAHRKTHNNAQILVQIGEEAFYAEHLVTN